MTPIANAHPYTDDDVMQFLKNQAKSLGLEIWLHESLLQHDGDFLYVPAHIELTDAFERAQQLQKLEDKWNNEEPKRYPRIMIVPTKD